MDRDMYMKMVAQLDQGQRQLRDALSMIPEEVVLDCGLAFVKGERSEMPEILSNRIVGWTLLIHYCTMRTTCSSCGEQDPTVENYTEVYLCEACREML